MSRGEARVLTAIWSNREFLELSPAAQRMYLLLLSQAPLTFAGTIAMTLRRWASYSPGTTVEDVEKALTELEAHPFVVVDWDAEELLVRSFIKNDQVFKQPNLMVCAARDATGVTSPKLRAALRQELLALPLTDEDRAKTTTRGKMPLTVVIQEMIESLSDGSDKGVATPSGYPFEKGIDNPQRKGIATPLGAGDGEALRTKRNLLSPSPSSVPPAPGSSALSREMPPPTMLGSKLLDEHVKALPHRPPRDVHRQLGERIDQLLDEKFDADVIRRALAKLRTKPHLGAGILPTLVNEEVNAAPNGRYTNDVWTDTTEVDL